MRAPTFNELQDKEIDSRSRPFASVVEVFANASVTLSDA
jgi:hypothetical protein